MRWFRFYSEALNDPKAQLLPDRLFKQWVNILCIVNEQEPSRGRGSGRLPKDISSTAYLLHMGVDEAKEVISSLVEWGLIDDEKGRYVVHKWQTRQPKSDSSADRVKKHRAKQGRNVTETPPEGEVEERRVRGRSRGEEDPETAQTSSLRTSPSHDTNWDFAVDLYARNIGPLDTRTRNELRGLYDRVPDPRWMHAAINQAGAAEKPGFGYVKNTIEDCLRTRTAPSTLIGGRRRPVAGGAR